MKSIILASLIYVFLNLSVAQAGLILEPVIGTTRVERRYPAPSKFVFRPVSGVRALVGTFNLAFEAEAGQSAIEETFESAGLKVNYVVQRGFLGIRSYIWHGHFTGIFLRGGVRAKKEKREIQDTLTSLTTTEEDITQFDPYFGSGLTFSFGQHFGINFTATAAYNRNNLSATDKLDTLYTASLSIKSGGQK